MNGTNGNGSVSRSNKANGGGIHPSLSICVDSGTIALVGKLNIYDEKRVERWLRMVLADQAIEILSLSDFDFSSAKLLSIPL